MGALFVDLEPDEDESRFQPLTDEEYEANLSYLNEQIDLLYKQFTQVCSKNACTQMKKEFQKYGDRDYMNSLGPYWKDFLHEMIQVYCLSTISAQIKYSSKAVRKAMTKDDVIRKLEILGVTNEQVQSIAIRDWEKFAGPALAE